MKRNVFKKKYLSVNQFNIMRRVCSKNGIVLKSLEELDNRPFLGLFKSSCVVEYHGSIVPTEHGLTLYEQYQSHRLGERKNAAPISNGIRAYVKGKIVVFRKANAA